MFVYPFPVYYFPYYRQQFPPVSPDLFHQSAMESKKLMQDASIVLNAISESLEFDKALMEAAQASDTKKVNDLINSIGTESDVHVTFNPDGIRLEFRSKVSYLDCCILTVSLRWR